MNHLLLIRLSALGDVLMTIPCVDSLARQYPDMRITFAGPAILSKIFRRLPKNVDYICINKREFSGASGILQLFRKLRAQQPTHVCDLHNVLRTKVVRLLFRIYGTPTSHIIKNRKEQRKFLSTQPKKQQETVFERQTSAIARLGFTVDIGSFAPFSSLNRMGGVGIAPFAAHQGKIYPLEKMEVVARMLSGQGRSVYVFGAGKKEKALAEQWESKYDGVHSLIEKLNGIDEEMDFIGGLDVMISMDSANMHLASLTTTPVISIWGATHPYGGFLGRGQSLSNAIQMDDMGCRPCSMYGDKPCIVGNYPCLGRIVPERIVEKVNELCG